MRPLLLAAALSALAGGGSAIAADPGARTYANPACSARDVNPEKCIINDGAPTRLGTTRTGLDPGTPPPANGGNAAPPAGPQPTPTLRKGWK